MRRMTAEEMAALAALRRGYLEPLAPLLRDRKSLHPMLSARLADILDGSAAVDFELITKLKSGISPKQSHASRQEQKAKDSLIARAVEEAVASGLVRKQAFAHAAERYGCSPSTASRCYYAEKKSKDRIRRALNAHSKIARVNVGLSNIGGIKPG